MFVREIFELGYILHGDDKERENLERKRLSLVSAIRQQEARFLHELEQRQKFLADVASVHQKLGTSVALVELSEDTVGKCDANQIATFLGKIDCYYQRIGATMKSIAELRHVAQGAGRSQDAPHLKALECALANCKDDALQQAQRLSRVLHKNHSSHLLRDEVEESVVAAKGATEALTLRCGHYSKAVRDLHDTLSTAEHRLHHAAEKASKERARAEDQLNRLLENVHSARNNCYLTGGNMEEMTCAVKCVNHRVQDLLLWQAAALVSKDALLTTLQECHSQIKDTRALLGISCAEQLMEESLVKLIEEDEQSLQMRSAVWGISSFAVKAEHLSFEVEQVRCHLHEITVSIQSVRCELDNITDLPAWSSLANRHLTIAKESNQLAHQLDGLRNVLAEELGYIAAACAAICAEQTLHHGQLVARDHQLVNKRKMMICLEPKPNEGGTSCSLPPGAGNTDHHQQLEAHGQRVKAISDFAAVKHDVETITAREECARSELDRFDISHQERIVQQRKAASLHILRLQRQRREQAECAELEELLMQEDRAFQAELCTAEARLKETKIALVQELCCLREMEVASAPIGRKLQQEDDHQEVAQTNQFLPVSVDTSVKKQQKARMRMQA